MFFFAGPAQASKCQQNALAHVWPNSDPLLGAVLGAVLGGPSGPPSERKHKENKGFWSCSAALLVPFLDPFWGSFWPPCWAPSWSLGQNPCSFLEIPEPESGQYLVIPEPEGRDMFFILFQPGPGRDMFFIFNSAGLWPRHVFYLWKCNKMKLSCRGPSD